MIESLHNAFGLEAFQDTHVEDTLEELPLLGSLYC